MGASKSELWTQLLNLIKILDNTYLYGAVNSPNFLGMEEILQEAYVGNHVGLTQQRMTAMRGQLNAMLANGPSLLDPVVKELAKVGYNSTATSARAALDDIYQGMVDGTETVKERDCTFGAVAADVGNNSTGTVYRLTKNKDNHDLEGGFYAAGITKVLVTADAFTGGTEGAETAKIYGSGQVKTDELAIGTAPSESKTLQAVSSDSISNLISNAGFETITGTAPAISVSGWTMGDAADFDESAMVYRGAKSLKFVDNGNILQYITSASIDKTRPVFVLVRFNRAADACDGNLTIRLGSQTATVALVAQTGWNDLILGAGTDTKGWYDNFKEDYTGLGVRVQLTLDSRTGGSLLVDEVIIAQPTSFDGKYYMLTTGALTADCLVGDFWTFTDSVVNTGRTQTWIARLFGKFFPHTSGAPTYADV